MKKPVKTYTREEKRKYYLRKVLNLEVELQRAQDRLAYIESDEYQDWKSDLQEELKAKRKSRKSAG